MNQIEKQYFRSIGELDAVSSFHFIIKEGYRLALVTSEQLEKLQYQIVELLADQFNRWTGGQSSSVPVETGQRIQQSVFYTIGYYLKSLSDVECALETLKNNALKDLFLYGKRRIEEDREKAAELLLLIQEDRFSTDIFAYNDTLPEGLQRFFSSYDMDYEAHETPGSIDYPLSNDKMNLTGIDYIYGYLQKLQLENEFCGYFSNEEIHSLLRGYDRQYKELIFNVLDLVLTNAVGSILLGRSEIELSISEYDRQFLKHELTPLPKERLSGLVDDAVSKLCSGRSISNSQLVDYITASAVNLKSRLEHALEADGLQHLFLSAKEGEAEPAILFEDKAKLDHDSFRRLANEIRECRFVSDKITLLQREQLCITDLADLLEGDCFFGDEYTDVFAAIDDIQLALLTKKLPLDPADSNFLYEEGGQEWQSSLDSFLTNMDPRRKSAILALADQIESC